MSRVVLILCLLLCQLAHVIATLWMLGSIIVGSPRALRIALAYDRVGNVVTGGSGLETISLRAARGTQQGQRGWCLLCRLLDAIEANHCKNADGKDS